MKKCLYTVLQYKVNINYKIFYSFFLLLATFNLSAQNCTVNAGIDQTVCANSTVRLKGNVGGSFIDTTVTWTFSSGPVTPNIVNPNSLSTNASGLTAPGTYVFALNSDCSIGSATDLVNITVLAGATAVTPSGSFSGCYTPGTPISFTGVAPPGHTLSWRATTSAGTKGTFNGGTALNFVGNSPTVQFPPLPNGFCSPNTISHTISVRSTNTATGCSQTRTRTLSFRYNVGAVSAFVPPACGSCQTLLGTCAQNGSGTWTILTEPAGSSATISSASSPSTSICNMIPGSYEVVWTVTGGSGCVAGADTASFVSSGPGTVTPAETNSIYFCDSIPNTVTIAGNTTLNTESVKWLQLSGAPATITNDTVPVTTVTGLSSAGAPYIFIYNTFNDVGCNSYDTMRIETKQPIVIGDGPNRCNPSNLVGSRRELSGSFIRSFASDSLVVSVQYISGPMDSLYSNLDFVNKIGSANATGSNAADRKCNELLPKGSSFTQTWLESEIWKSSVITNSSIAFTLSARPSSTGCPATPTLQCDRLKDGLYTFLITIFNGCNTYTKEITWGLRADATVTSGTDQVLPCGFDSTTLAGVSNRFPDCNWKPFWNTIQTPAGATNPINATNEFDLNAPLSNLADGTYLFQLTGDPGGGTAGNCDFEIDTVQVVVSSLPPSVPSISGGTASPYCINTPVFLSGTADSVTAQGTWSIDSTSPSGGTGTFSPSINSPTVVFTPSTPNSNYIIRWTAENGCGAVYDSVLLSTNTVTAITPDISADPCNIGGNASSLSATPAGGVWTASNPNYTITTPTDSVPNVNPSSISLLRGAVTFFYTLADSITGGCGPITDSVTYVPSSAGVRVNAENQCDVSSFPFTFPVYFERISPYTEFNLFASGPNSPSLDKGVIFITGNGYQNDTLLLTVNGPGTYAVGTGSRSLNGCTEIDSRLTLIEVSDPAPLAVVGSDTILCNSNEITLDAQPTTLPTGTSGQWTVDTVLAGSAPTFDDASLPNAKATFTNGSDVILKWQTFGSNADCKNTSFSLKQVTYYPIASAGIDTTLCIFAPDTATSYNLGANNFVPAESGSWSIISEPSGSNANLFDSTLNNTGIEGLIAGTYTLRWTVSDSACTTSDDLVLTISNTCIPLPLHLNDFTAQKRACTAELSWKVYENLDIAEYSVLKKRGNQYFSLARIPVDVSSQGERTYVFTDEQAEDGANEYKIEIIGLDQSSTLSDSRVVRLDCDLYNPIVVYPNPVENELNILFYLEQEDFVTVNLRSLTGQILTSISKPIDVKQDQLLLNMKGYAAGSYYLEIHGEQLGRKTFKVLKTD